MFKWLRYLTAIPQLIGLVRGLLELVRTAEDLLAGGQQGAAKKALVLDLLETAVALGERLELRVAGELDRAQLRNAAAAVIDAVVAILNSAGVFKHGREGPERG